jgi:EAL domain-containing protein (putative c-di-GMP-specific phosphodiesterase class I)
MQGYLFSPPVAADRIVELLAAQEHAREDGVLLAG